MEADERLDWLTDERLKEMKEAMDKVYQVSLMWLDWLEKKGNNNVR